MNLIIKRGLDLRLTQDERLFYAQTHSLVILVNNAHTIAHGIIGDDPEMLIRVKLPSYLKGTHDNYLAKFLKNKVHWLLAVKPVVTPPPLAIEEEFITRRRYRNYRRRIL